MREASFGRSAVIPRRATAATIARSIPRWGTVYDTDTERQQQYGRANYKSRVMLYRKDCDTVMPLVVELKLQFALVGLNAEIAAPTKVVRAASPANAASPELVAASIFSSPCLLPPSSYAPYLGS